MALLLVLQRISEDVSIIYLRGVREGDVGRRIVGVHVVKALVAVLKLSIS